MRREGDVRIFGIARDHQSRCLFHLQLLRATLNKLNLQHVKIVVADGEWDIVSDLKKDPDLLSSIDIIGYVITLEMFVNLFFCDRKKPGSVYYMPKRQWRLVV